MSPMRRMQPLHFTRLFMMVVCSALGMISSASPATAQGEKTTVTCFKGNPAEGKTIGTVDVTFRLNAYASCNSTYYDQCREECVGCYTDPDSGKTVCYDSKGKIGAEPPWRPPK